MSDPTPPSDTEALMGEWLWDAWLRAGAYRDTGSRREAIESMTQAVHEFLTSDWLAAERAVQRAESWDEGYAKCSDDFERHLNHAPLFDCDCPEDPLLANPHRSGAQC